MKFISIKITAIMLFLANIVLAQDIHFSQFENVPHSLNPALTGAFDGKFRIGGAYRNQWASIVKNGYSTPTLYLDFPLLRSKNGDKLAVGVNLLSDRAGSAVLTNNSANLSIAYHKSLGAAGKHVLSLGFQGGYVLKSINREKLNLGDEWDGNGGFTDVSASGDNAYLQNVGNPDLNAGLVWNSTFSKRFAFYVGGGYFHLIKPKENFVDNTIRAKNELQPRYQGYGGFTLGLGDKFRVNPQVLYQYQQKASELVGNLVFGYDIVSTNKKSATFMFGGGYRNADAAIAMAGVDIDKRLKMMLSYDFTTSQLRNANSNGAIEFTLSWILRDTEGPEVRPVLFCPRF